MRTYKHQNLWHGCVGAWCPSVDRSRSTLLTDLSVQRNNGTLTNMDPGSDLVTSESKIALDFDGTNDYVALARVPVTTAPLTISCWFRVGNVTSYRYLFSIAGTANNTNYVSLASRGDVAGDPAELEIKAGGASTTIRTGKSVVANQWMHMAGVIDPATSVCYLDGITASAATPTIPTCTRASIGVFYALNLDGYMLGQIDDIRVYNRALTASEIRMLGLRRGIAYETTRPRRARLRRTTSSNNMLVGCGL
jgi:Concanavalin A-like lectin/glucanases superfamily